MTLLTILKLIGGLLALVGGGDLLIRGASRIAATLGVSSLVIGLTIVAFGTSSPELVVSLQSSFAGHADMAVANVVGSNIFNILLILGACALTAPLIVNSQLVRLDVPLMASSALLFFLFALNHNISTLEGLILVSILAAYTVFLIRKSRRETKEIKAEFDEEYSEAQLKQSSLALNIVLVMLGLGLLVLGGDWLVSSAVTIAQSLGVSETVIGLTIVAGGTSLPEVATSVLATLKGQRDIAIGNVVGSNIFNVLLIIGLSSIIAPGGLRVSPQMMDFDFPVMLAIGIACLPIFLAGFRITRLDGAIFLGCYIIYILFIVLKATEHELLKDYHYGIMNFALPLISLSLLISILQAIKTLRKRSINQ